MIHHVKVNKLLIVVPLAHLVKLVLSPKYVKAQFSQEWLNYLTMIIKSQAKQVTKWLQVSAARLVDGWNCQLEAIIFHTQKIHMLMSPPKKHSVNWEKMCYIGLQVTLFQ